MSSGRSSITLGAWVAALAVFAGGLALVAAANRSLAGARVRIEKRTQELNALRAIERRLRRYESALNEVESRQPPPPTPVQAVVTNALPVAGFEFRPLAATNTIPAWSLRMWEVSAKSVSIDAAMRAVRELDSVWPRWVLADLQVRAGAEAGTGRVTLRVESVARQDPGGSSQPR